jgi:NTE family protein
MGGTALVLGGGGVTGIAWELGVLAGLAEVGLDLTRADVVVGTSAGSVVGAIVTNGEPLETAYARQLAGQPRTVPTQRTAERPARVGVGLILRYAGAALVRDEQRSRAKIGALALAARTCRSRSGATSSGLGWRGPIGPPRSDCS